MYERLYSDVDGKLDSKSRKKLMQVILQYTTHNKIWVPQESYRKVFDMIKAVYPDESMDIWYIPRSEGNRNPGGIIFSGFKYEREKLATDCGLRKNCKKGTKNEESNQSSIGIDDDAESTRKLLIGRDEPWDQILDDWKKTVEYRRKEICSLKLVDVFNRWPKYKKTRGKELVSNYLFYNLKIYFFCIK